jgi:predicted DNA-binding transcriptional regulator AlpA
MAITETRGMTRAELLELASRSLTTDLPTAGRAWGMGRNTAFDLYHKGQFPVEVLKLGRRLRVRTADLVAALDDRAPAGAGQVA